jgi:predicted porin
VKTRYAAAGLRYKAGKAAVVLAGDYTLYSNSNATYKNLDNGYSVILGGNYDFGVAKVFAKATYFDNQASATDSFSLLSDSKTVGVEGWGVELSTAVPAFGGTVLGTVGYRDAKNVDNSDAKFKRWNAALGYAYAFSKRTSVYAAAGYAQEKSNAKDRNAKDRKASAAQAGFGLVHKF